MVKRGNYSGRLISILQFGHELNSHHGGLRYNLCTEVVLKPFSSNNRSLVQTTALAEKSFNDSEIACVETQRSATYGRYAYAEHVTREHSGMLKPVLPHCTVYVNHAFEPQLNRR